MVKKLAILSAFALFSLFVGWTITPVQRSQSYGSER